MRFYRCPMARFFKGKKWTHFDDSKYKHKLHISKSWQNGWQITTFFSLRVSLESEWTVKSSNTRQVPKIKFLWAVTFRRCCFKVLSHFRAATGAAVELSSFFVSKVSANTSPVLFWEQSRWLREAAGKHIPCWRLLWKGNTCHRFCYSIKKN